MVAGFNEIAASMDRMYPPRSMRTLARRFRYIGIEPGTLPPGSVSLREMAMRVAGEPVAPIELLHYNTCLMQDTIRIADFVKAIGGWGQLLVCMRLSVAEVLAHLLARVGSAGVCDRIFPPIFSVCGVSINPLNDACKLVGTVGELAEFIIKHFGGVVDVIFDLIGAPLEIIVDVLGGILGVVIPFEIYSVDKPDMILRSMEIGPAVSTYDIVSLCEVWKDEQRDTILGGASSGSLASFGDFGEPGPGAWEHLGSGLLMFSPRLSVVDHSHYVFDKSVEWEAGVVRRTAGGCDFGRVVDADLWANKGILLTVMDVGLGHLELYSTHTYSGGDMLEGAPADLFGGAPTREEKAMVRRAQISRLAAFIARTHRPANVAIIAGDFNVESDERAFLQDALKDVGGLRFDDWYALQPFTEVYPEGVVAGHTNRGASRPTFDSYCKIFPQDRAAPRTVRDDYYCREDAPMDPNPAGERIDYVFIQRPVGDHAFNLDVSRVRRRAFRRSYPYPGTEQFMSDHVGLEVTLFVTRRR